MSKLLKIREGASDKSTLATISTLMSNIVFPAVMSIYIFRCIVHLKSDLGWGSVALGVYGITLILSGIVESRSNRWRLFWAGPDIVLLGLITICMAVLAHLPSNIPLCLTAASGFLLYLISPSERKKTKRSRPE